MVLVQISDCAIHFYSVHKQTVTFAYSHTTCDFETAVVLVMYVHLQNWLSCRTIKTDTNLSLAHLGDNFIYKVVASPSNINYDNIRL